MNNCNKYDFRKQRKRFGQHFLQNEDIIQKIISEIAPKKNEILVEIGPGLGALTYPISTYLDNLIVIEIDRDLAKKLKCNTDFSSKIIVYQQDVMTIDFLKLAKKYGQKLRVFGNLPYNISTKLIFYLFNYINCIKDMHFMLQEEVVHRLVAKPGNKSYGRLSIMSQYYCDMIPLLKVSPDAFIPLPKVNSMVMRYVPFISAPYYVSNIQLLKYITTQAFSQRRKTIRNSLGHLFSHDIMYSFNINDCLRAENLSLSQYCQLTNWLDANRVTNFSTR